MGKARIASFVVGALVGLASVTACAGGTGSSSPTPTNTGGATPNAVTPTTSTTSTTTTTTTTSAPAAVGVTGDWHADMGALMAATQANAPASAQVTCTGTAHLKFTASGTFEMRSDPTCSLQSMTGRGTITAGGNYTASDTQLKFTDTKTTGKMTFGGGVSVPITLFGDGIATYGINGDTLKISHEGPRGTITHTWTRG